MGVKLKDFQELSRYTFKDLDKEMNKYNMNITQEQPKENKLTGEYKEHFKEYERCRKNPYYFATKYLTVDGKPFTTNLNETEFNSFYNLATNK